MNCDLVTALFSIAFAASAVVVASRYRYFSPLIPEMPDAARTKAIGALETTFAFIIYLSVQLFFPPLIHCLLALYNQATFEEMHLNPHLDLWLTNSALITSFVALGAFSISFPLRRALFGNSSPYQASLFGLWSLIIAYPIVNLVNVCLTLFLFHGPLDPKEEQIAIIALKKSADCPLLLLLSCFNIVLTVPFLEELLFRGYLQQSLKKALPTQLAIVATALIFSSFHYSTSQGKENIALLTSLFTLSLFLGWNREKTGSLFSSIGLHSLFNLLNVIGILYLKQ